MPMNEDATRILGRWKAAPSPDSRPNPYGQVGLEFRPDGQLLYSARAGGVLQQVLLVFHLEEGFVVTDQPSAPKVVRTRYAFSPEGGLMLAFGGKESWYVRDPG